MKRFVVLLLLLVYGASSLGMSVHFHYCCGKLKDVNVIYPALGCEIDHGQVNPPCCDDKEVNLKIKSDQNSSKIFCPTFQSLAVTTLFTSDGELVINEINRKIVSDSFRPPSLKNNLLHLICSYRI